jgi:hypothetical protein
LSEEENYRKLCMDLRNTVAGRGWKAGADATDFTRIETGSRGVASAFNQVMTTLATRDGKRIWCEKTPMYVHHIGQIAQAFPAAKFIHVVRDGRECAASFHRRWGFNPFRSIARWKLAVRAGVLQGSSVRSRYCEVRYEDLTTDPERYLHCICEFLSIPYESSLLNPTRVRPGMTGSVATSIKQNERRAIEYFGQLTVSKLEAIAGKQLEFHGYPVTDRDGDKDPPALKMWWWQWTDDLRRFRDTALGADDGWKSNHLGYLVKRVVAARKQKRALK